MDEQNIWKTLGQGQLPTIHVGIKPETLVEIVIGVLFVVTYAVMLSNYLSKKK